MRNFSEPYPSDTLLNVFLAIAVDNLANAQELTAAEEEAAEEEEKVAAEAAAAALLVTMHLSPSCMHKHLSIWITSTFPIYLRQTTVAIKKKHNVT